MKEISDHGIRSSRHRLTPLPQTAASAGLFERLEIIQLCLEDAAQPFRSGRSPCPHHHLLFYVMRGEYALWAPSGLTPLPEGTLVGVRCGTLRQFLLTSEEGRNAFVYLRPGTVWDGWFSTPRRIQPCACVAHLERAMRGYLESCGSADVASEELAALYGSLIETLLSRELQSAESVSDRVNRGRIQRIQEAVAAQPERGWTVRNMAHLAGISVPHLYAICRRLINTSPLEMVIESRMRKACYLLQTTDETLSEVAAAVGYGSEFSFSRLFLKHVGMRPGRYRRG